jgi:tetratricopeptide (TPR) repeat protein
MKASKFQPKTCLELALVIRLTGLAVGSLVLLASTQLDALASPLSGLNNLTNFKSPKNESEQVMKQVYQLEKTDTLTGLTQATRLLEGLIAKRRDVAEAHLELGRIQNRLGNQDQAIMSLMEALTLLSDNPIKGLEARETIGAIYMKRGNYDEAGGQFKKIVDASPTNVTARGNLGICLEQIGFVDLAIEEFKKVLAVEPNNFVSLYNLGLATSLKGDYNAACAYFEKAMTKNPREPQVAMAVLGLASCYEAKQQYPEAKLMIDKVISLDARNHYAYLAKARIYEALKEPGKAIECIRKAMQLAPNDANCKAAMSELLIKSMPNTASLDRLAH